MLWVLFCSWYICMHLFDSNGYKKTWIHAFELYRELLTSSKFHHADFDIRLESNWLNFVFIRSSSLEFIARKIITKINLFRVELLIRYSNIQYNIVTVGLSQNCLQFRVQGQVSFFDSIKLQNSWRDYFNFDAAAPKFLYGNFLSILLVWNYTKNFITTAMIISVANLLNWYQTFHLARGFITPFFTKSKCQNSFMNKFKRKYRKQMLNLSKGFKKLLKRYLT